MQGEVKYVNRGVEHFGTYRIDGRMLELTCRHGTRRAVIGLFEARVLARKLLKFLVMKADRAASRPAQLDSDAKPRAPDPPTASQRAGWPDLPLVRVAPADAKHARPVGGAALPAA